MTSPTPGPWFTVAHGSIIEVVSVTGRKKIARFPNQPEDRENAFLTAAAPELFAACLAQQELIRDMARFVAAMPLRDYALFNDAPILALNAIAKATEVKP